jgi:hypothetical protein
MINWIVTINKPMQRQANEILIPKDKVNEFITHVLENNDWSLNDSITIKPTEMEYFDG